MSLASVRAVLEAQHASLANIVPAVGIATSSIASPTVITTLTPHGIPWSPIPATVLCTISGHVGSTPALSGIYRARATGPSTLTLQTNAPTPANVAVTIGGSGGTFQANLTAYENVPFDPVTGVPYERIFVKWAAPRATNVADASKMRRGFLQVTICWPIGVGTGGAAARADAIEAGFPNNSTITSGGQSVKIMSPADVTLMGIEDDRDVTVVRIRFSER